MDASARKRAVLDRSARFVCPRRVAFWEESGTQLVMGRREGDVVWDIDGHELYDLHINGGTFNLGHRNPEVIAAMVDAAGELDIGNHHFASVARTDLGEELARLTPGDLAYSVFTPSGAEANDVAIKSARRATGRRKIVSLDYGYHGRTGLSGGAGDDTDARYFLSDQPDEFVRVAFADADAIERALRGGDVAAVMLETIPATAGFPVPPPGYLAEVARLAREHDALYIADEVQTGLGRTGDLWGVETFGVEPDVLVTGKGLSGGVYPMAAAVLNPRAGSWLSEHGWGHVATFGGSEIGCRVAQKVLEITTRPEVMENARRLAQTFGEALDELRRNDHYLVEIRQTGLVMGLVFDDPNGAVYVQRELYDRGVWAIASGFDRAVLQWKPSLLMSPAIVGDLIDRLASAMAAARHQSYPAPIRRPRGDVLPRA
jgi:acetylornithine/succinyldiaminopimelate/putrescine aminotransferase